MTAAEDPTDYSMDEMKAHIRELLNDKK